VWLFPDVTKLLVGRHSLKNTIAARNCHETPLRGIGSVVV